MNRQRKAVSLISGGLDSLLATKVVMDQGVHVEGINFYTGFCVEGHTHAIRRKDRDKQKRNNALWVAEQLGIKLHIIDVIEEYKSVLINPEHGYGANMNPCHDCKTFMISKADEWIKEHDFDFIITGEVMGQRPMSQRKETMPVIARESGAGERLLRPLCAKHMPESLPEREGWVKRDELLNFHGRSRKPQIALAKHYGFEAYAQPAGGCCFLTDKKYSDKLVDLWQARGNKEYEMDDIMLLKIGRHIRPAEHYKLIIAREEGEVKFMQGYRRRFISIRTVSHMGPLALIDGEPTDEDLLFAARITARYSKGKEAEEVELEVSRPDYPVKSVKVVPLAVNDMSANWLL
jgi:tRNA U34 2-thiouridine synthase MnmA/TrmU